MAQPDYRFKVILLGDMNVGKTSLIVRFTEGSFSEDAHPEIDQTHRDIVVDGKQVRILITDTAGQERFRTLTSSYYRNAHAIIVCYAVDDKTTFQNVAGHITEATRYSTRSEKFIVANKQDLEEDHVVSDAEGMALAQSMSTPFHKTSAKTGSGVEDLFNAVARALLSGGAASIASGDALDLNAKSDKPKKDKCMI